MALTAQEEAIVKLMMAERVAQADAQAQSLLDSRQTATGQLTGLKPLLSPEKLVEVEAELRTVEATPLKG